MTSAPRERGVYMAIVRATLRRPVTTLFATVALLVGVQYAYGKFGNGVEFFPNVEPDYGLVQLHARGNLSLAEKDRLIRTVEERILALKEIRTVYARAGEGQKGSSEISEDTVGTIQFEFVDWQHRRPAHAIMEEIRTKSADIPGVTSRSPRPRAVRPQASRSRCSSPATIPTRFRRPRRRSSHPRRQARGARPRQRPAAARHRLDHPRQQDRGRQVRGQRRDGWHRGPARDQWPEDHRIPAERHRQVGRPDRAVPGRPAQSRRARGTAHEHAGRLGAYR